MLKVASPIVSFQDLTSTKYKALVPPCTLLKADTLEVTNHWKYLPFTNVFRWMMNFESCPCERNNKDKERRKV